MVAYSVGRGSTASFKTRGVCVCVCVCVCVQFQTAYFLFSKKHLEMVRNVYRNCHRLYMVPRES